MAKSREVGPRDHRGLSSERQRAGLTRPCPEQATLNHKDILAVRELTEDSRKEMDACTVGKFTV